MNTAPSTAPPPPAFPDQPTGLPRLLAGVSPNGALSLAAHAALHGPLPIDRASRRAHPDLIDEIERAGLRGRGGAGYPTARKLRAVAASRGRPVVVINAAEGEPASYKDRILTEALPQLVLDGGVIAARALGADELIVGVSAAAPASYESLTAALAERGSFRGAPSIRPVVVPDRYLTGQESALVAFLNGGPALPTFTPPRPYRRGVRGRPTLLSNAETFAQIGLIARHGARWFRELGTSTQPGSALVTLTGAVTRPGVYEIEYGMPLTSLIDAAGGLISRPRALLLGGYGGSWVEGEYLDELVLADDQLEPYGASLGAGVVTVLSAHACLVSETVRVTRWLAAESAGQCGPCVNGLHALAGCLEELVRPNAPSPTRARVEQLTELVWRRGACAHPDGAVKLVRSAIDAFEGEFAEHAQRGPCERCSRSPELPLPKRRPTTARA